MDPFPSIWSDTLVMGRRDQGKARVQLVDG